MKYITSILLSLPLALLFVITTAEAKSGCCSWHGGVDYCSYSGYYMCNDGTESPSCTCGGYDSYMIPSYTSPSYTSPSYTIPSYYTTPSCPLFASYSYLSKSCECSYGYVASGGKCISEDDTCEDQYGSHAKSSYGGKCTCDYGYRFNSAGSKCVSNADYCEDLDWNAKYDYLSSSCQCKDGYKAGFSGTSCVRDYDEDDYTPLYIPSYIPSSYSYCPSNSHDDPSDSTKCLCDSGYELNKKKNGCVPYIACAKNSYEDPTDNQMCLCTGNYKWNAAKTSCDLKVKNTTQKTSSKSSIMTKACKKTATGTCKCAGGYKAGKINGKTLCVKK